MELNDRLNRCAMTLNDEKLLSKLSAGDTVALELKYHPACLAVLYSKQRSHLNRHRNEESTELAITKEACPTAFSEIVTYIIETNNNSSEAVIFRLAGLISLYKERLQQLGVPSPDVNAARLKEQLLSHVPQLEAHRPGRDCTASFPE